MDLDLNEYYCSSNLPGLYRKRNRKGDQERARAVLNIVMAACGRAKRRGTSDEWLRPPLLAGAFDLGDADQAEELRDELADEGPALWQVGSVAPDVAAVVAQVEHRAGPNEANRR